MEELQKRLDLLRQTSTGAAGELNALQAQRGELKVKARNLAEAIAVMGHSPTLLASVEPEIEGLDKCLTAAHNPQQFTVSIEELREFVTKKAFDLTAVLRPDAATARRALAHHVQKLVLTPKETPDGQVLAVSGDVDLSAATTV